MWSWLGRWTFGRGCNSPGIRTRTFSSASSRVRPPPRCRPRKAAACGEVCGGTTWPCVMLACFDMKRESERGDAAKTSLLQSSGKRVVLRRQWSVSVSRLPSATEAAVGERVLRRQQMWRCKCWRKESSTYLRCTARSVARAEQVRIVAAWKATQRWHGHSFAIDRVRAAGQLRCTRRPHGQPTITPTPAITGPERLTFQSDQPTRRTPF